MRRIALGIGAIIALCGCTDRFAGQGGRGIVQLGQMTTDTRTEVVRVATKSDPLASDPTYRLTIYDKTNQVVEQFEDCSTVGELILKAGSYSFVAEAGKPAQGAQIDAPYFRGQTNVFVEAGKTRSVKMTARLNNVRISAAMSDLIKDNFKEYSLSVLEVPLQKADILAGRSLYIDGTQSSFTWILRMVNNQGTECFFYQEVTGVKGCSHYRFSFDIDNTATEDQGQVLLNLTVDTQVEHIEEDIDISLEQYPVPTVAAQGNFELGKQVVVNEKERGMEMRVNLTAQGGVGVLKVRHTNPALAELGIPMLIEPTKLDATATEAIAKLGLSWSPSLAGSKDAWIDWSTLANTVSLGDYRFYVTLEDQVGQRVDCLVYFVVLPDQDHITGMAEVGAKYAVLHGDWCTLVRPEGLSFQYRTQGAEEWTIADPASVVDGQGKAFSLRIKGLTPNQTYEYRTYSPAAGEKQGQEVVFTTFDAPEIPNLSFDNSYWSGSTWYPNASGGNSYWATGNEGVTAGPLNMNSNNVEETVDVLGGKAVRLRSVEITFGLSPIKFASGGMFTGTYKTNMTDPLASVSFGRPYTGRPLALKGWYKYKPKTINTYKYDSDSWAMGSMDKCHIFISLEHWGSATSRPSSPQVIGYAEMLSDQTVETWSEFRLDIDYKDASRVPTHVVLVTSASYLGGTFCGGIGSELMIDEFELVWE